MASGDPKLGVADSWRRSDIPTKSKEDDTKPTLYHTDTSYYSQVVRLVLEEEGIDYVSRHLDIHGSMEQLEPWYLHINPAGVVPTLVYRGRSVTESKDVSLFIVEKVSGTKKLLPAELREQVLQLVELHYKETPVEMLTMGTMLSSNKVMAAIGPRKLKSAIARLEKMKSDHPDLEAVIQAKIGQKKEQQEMFSNPQKAKELALGKVIAVLDHLEESLEKEGDFLCGPSYTLADTLFTCLLARLGMIRLLEGELKSR